MYKQISLIGLVVVLMLFFHLAFNLELNCSGFTVCTLEGAPAKVWKTKISRRTFLYPLVSSHGRRSDVDLSVRSL